MCKWQHMALQLIICIIFRLVAKIHRRNGECRTNPYQHTHHSAQPHNEKFVSIFHVWWTERRRDGASSTALNWISIQLNIHFFSSCSLFSSYLIKLPLLVLRISSHKCICEKSTLVCRQIHKLCYSLYANCLRIRTHTHYTCIHELKMLCSPAEQLTHFYLGVNKPISLLFHYFTA